MIFQYLHPWNSGLSHSSTQDTLNEFFWHLPVPNKDITQPTTPRARPQRSEGASVRCQCKTLSFVEAMPSSKDLITSRWGSRAVKKWRKRMFKLVKEWILLMLICIYIYIHTTYVYMYIYHTHNMYMMYIYIYCLLGVMMINDVQTVWEQCFLRGRGCFISESSSKSWCISTTTMITKQTRNNDEQWSPYNTKTTHWLCLTTIICLNTQGSPFETAEVQVGKTSGGLVDEHRLGLPRGISDPYIDYQHLKQKVPQFIA